MTNPVNWWEILTPEPARLVEFYSGLFGWEFTEEAETSYWELAQSSGGAIGGGIGAAGDLYEGVSLYAQVEDVNRYLGRAEEMGGEVLSGPVELPEQAVLGSFSDPDGNRFALVDYFHEPEWDSGGKENAVVWWELATGRWERLREFYRGVFGWEEKLDTHVEDYAIMRSGDGGIEGGLCKPQAGRTYLTFYVRVESVKAVAGKVEELGGRIIREVEALEEMGEAYALAEDPAGNPFGLFSDV